MYYIVYDFTQATIVLPAPPVPAPPPVDSRHKVRKKRQRKEKERRIKRSKKKQLRLKNKKEEASKASLALAGPSTSNVGTGTNETVFTDAMSLTESAQDLEDETKQDKSIIGDSIGEADLKFSVVDIKDEAENNACAEEFENDKSDVNQSFPTEGVPTNNQEEEESVEPMDTASKDDESHAEMMHAGRDHEEEEAKDSGVSICGSVEEEERPDNKDKLKNTESQDTQEKVDVQTTNVVTETIKPVNKKATKSHKRTVTASKSATQSEKTTSCPDKDTDPSIASSSPLPVSQCTYSPTKSTFKSPAKVNASALAHIESLVNSMKEGKGKPSPTNALQLSSPDVSPDNSNHSDAGMTNAVESTAKSRKRKQAAPVKHERKGGGIKVAKLEEVSDVVVEETESVTTVMAAASATRSAVKLTKALNQSRTTPNNSRQGTGKTATNKTNAFTTKSGKPVPMSKADLMDGNTTVLTTKPTVINTYQTHVKPNQPTTQPTNGDYKAVQSPPLNQVGMSRSGTLSSTRLAALTATTRTHLIPLGKLPATSSANLQGQTVARTAATNGLTLAQTNLLQAQSQAFLQKHSLAQKRVVSQAQTNNKMPVTNKQATTASKQQGLNGTQTQTRNSRCSSKGRAYEQELLNQRQALMNRQAQAHAHAVALARAKVHITTSCSTVTSTVVCTVTSPMQALLSSARAQFSSSVRPSVTTSPSVLPPNVYATKAKFLPSNKPGLVTSPNSPLISTVTPRSSKAVVGSCLALPLRAATSTGNVRPRMSTPVQQVRTSRPVSVSTSRQVSTSTPRPVKASPLRPLNASVGASTPRPVNMPTPRPVNMPTPRPVNMPTPRPVNIPTPRPAVSVSTPRPVSVPTPRPVSVPTPRPVSVPKPRPLNVPKTRPVTMSTPQSVNGSSTRSVNMSTPRPVSVSTSQPVNVSAQRPVNVSNSRPMHMSTTNRPVNAPTMRPGDASMQSVGVTSNTPVKSAAHTHTSTSIHGAILTNGNHANAMPSPSSANGYDAPLELTTKKTRSREREAREKAALRIPALLKT